MLAGTLTFTIPRTSIVTRYNGLTLLEPPSFRYPHQIRMYRCPQLIAQLHPPLARISLSGFDIEGIHVGKTKRFVARLPIIGGFDE